MSASELCAGGEDRGKDPCTGEGGAPLVCLDEKKDQYFLVGLVNYSLGDCGDEIPAVYVNMADPCIRRFVTTSFGDPDFCQTDFTRDDLQCDSEL